GAVGRNLPDGPARVVSHDHVLAGVEDHAVGRVDGTAGGLVAVDHGGAGGPVAGNGGDVAVGGRRSGHRQDHRHDERRGGEGGDDSLGHASPPSRRGAFGVGDVHRDRPRPYDGRAFGVRRLLLRRRSFVIPIRGSTLPCPI